MSEGGVRSRRSAGAGPRGVVVVGDGQLATALRERLLRPGPTVSDTVPWAASASGRVVVVVAPAGEFGERSGRTGSRGSFVELAVRAGALAEGAVQVVVVSSAMVHGASPGRATIADDEPAAPGTEGIAADLRAFEEAVADAVGDVPLTLVRPAVVVGPGIDTMLTRHFEAPRLLTVRGGDRTWQFVHVDDLAAALRIVVAGRLTGAVTVGALAGGAPDELSTEEVAAASGMRTIPMPEATAFAVAERLHRVGALPSPASDLAFVVYPWTVSARRLHDTGWSPGWSSAACLEVLLGGVRGRLGVGGRRLGGADAAALGAAGAAVAAIGTAAIWRRARRRR